MAYERSSYHRKWWVKTIRERNYFGHRYWWFNWSLLLGCIIAFYFSYNYLKEDTDQTCLNRNNLSRRIDGINDALDDCCACTEQSEIIPEDTLRQERVECNSAVHSGGYGIDEKQVFLGTNSGRVVIHFNKYNKADKMEVFYEGKRIESTYSINGNVDGFVGDNNQVKNGEDELSFNYNFHQDKFIVVKVTGLESGTSWNYNVNCPR